jgi:hypothetical protein
MDSQPASKGIATLKVELGVGLRYPPTAALAFSNSYVLMYQQTHPTQAPTYMAAWSWPAPC